jgi:hypothetical protein
LWGGERNRWGACIEPTGLPKAISFEPTGLPKAIGVRSCQAYTRVSYYLPCLVLVDPHLVLCLPPVSCAAVFRRLRLLCACPSTCACSLSLSLSHQALVEGSSACNCGILPGDCLMEANGQNVYCKGIEQATKVCSLGHCALSKGFAHAASDLAFLSAESCVHANVHLPAGMSTETQPHYRNTTHPPTHLLTHPPIHTNTHMRAFISAADYCFITCLHELARLFWARRAQL